MLYVLSLRAGGTSGEQTQQVGAPTIEQTIEATAEQTVIEETTS
jgi:hypothetical protein